MDAEIAPRYARLHTEHPVDTDAILREGPSALSRTALTRNGATRLRVAGARQVPR